MPDTMPAVRWRRTGYKDRMGRHRFTRYHVDSPVPADRMGRTACGLRYKRTDADYGTVGDGELCRNCAKALRSIPDPPDVRQAA